MGSVDTTRLRYLWPLRFILLSRKWGFSDQRTDSVKASYAVVCFIKSGCDGYSFRYCDITYACDMIWRGGEVIEFEALLVLSYTQLGTRQKMKMIKYREEGWFVLLYQIYFVTLKNETIFNKNLWKFTCKCLANFHTFSLWMVRKCQTIINNNFLCC